MKGNWKEENIEAESKGDNKSYFFVLLHRTPAVIKKRGMCRYLGIMLQGHQDNMLREKDNVQPRAPMRMLVVAREEGVFLVC